VDYSLDVNELNVLTERRPGLSEIRTKGTETEKVRDAKEKVTAGLRNWLVEDNLSCVAG